VSASGATTIRKKTPIATSIALGCAASQAKNPLTVGITTSFAIERQRRRKFQKRGGGVWEPATTWRGRTTEAARECRLGRPAALQLKRLVQKRRRRQSSQRYTRPAASYGFRLLARSDSVLAHAGALSDSNLLAAFFQLHSSSYLGSRTSLRLATHTVRHCNTRRAYAYCDFYRCAQALHHRARANGVKLLNHRVHRHGTQVAGFAL
jgi:hypothetical protein